MNPESLAPIPPLTAILTGRPVETLAVAEPLVDLADYSEGLIRCSPKYAVTPSAPAGRCFARRSVAQRLVAAHSLLPAGLHFLVYDAWRPLDTQKRLFDSHVADLLAAHPDWTAAKANAEAARFVTNPYEVTPPHCTGGAVDLTLASADGSALWCGTEFDDFCGRSTTRYFEEAAEMGSHLDREDEEALVHRRILFHALTRAGLINYPAEWWHFDYGDALWAQVVGKLALFGAIDGPREA
jgi:D-alanyl-D-alanine dipeptidase